MHIEYRYEFPWYLFVKSYLQTIKMRRNSQSCFMRYGANIQHNMYLTVIVI